jgi:Tol biopolymer transport system component
MIDEREALERALERLPAEPGIVDRVYRRRRRKDRNQRIGAGLVTVAVVTAVAVVLANAFSSRSVVPTHPRPTYNHNGEIAIYGYIGDQWAVMAIDPTTGRQRALPITGVQAQSNPTLLAWSPDGSQLAYTVSDEVRILDVRTGSSRTIAACDPFCEGLAWSPDGSTIAMAPPGSPSLRLIGTDGQLQASLTPKPGWGVGEPAWSPDGSRIAFVAGKLSQVDGPTFLYVMNRDGSDVRLLVSDVLGFAASPAWSPDGTKIAYLRGEPVNDGSGDSEVIVSTIDSDGSNPVQVLRAGRCACVGFTPGLTWSPDGTKLAVVTAAMPDGRGGLATVNPDGTGLRFLGGGWGNPAWRPVP